MCRARHPANYPDEGESSRPLLLIRRNLSQSCSWESCWGCFSSWERRAEEPEAAWRVAGLPRPSAASNSSVSSPGRNCPTAKLHCKPLLFTSRSVIPQAEEGWESSQSHQTQLNRRETSWDVHQVWLQLILQLPASKPIPALLEMWHWAMASSNQHKQAAQEKRASGRP